MAQSKLQKITTNFHHVKYFMLQYINTCGYSFSIIKPYISPDTFRNITLANHYLVAAQESLTKDIKKAKAKMRDSKNET